MVSKMVRKKIGGSRSRFADGDRVHPAEADESTPQEHSNEIREKIDVLRKRFPDKFGEFEKVKSQGGQKDTDAVDSDLSPEEKEAANYKLYYDHLISTIMKLNDMYDWDDDYEEPDYKSLRLRKRKLCTWLYSPLCLNLATFSALATAILEILSIIGLLAFPKTFVPALRYGSYVPLLLLLMFTTQALFHLYCFTLGLSLRKIKSWEIGFVAPTWPFPFPILPFISLFLITVCWYACQDWRISREMYHHMALYNSHWFPTENWDSYQIMMRCCGVTNYKDWQIYGPRFDLLGKKLLHIPQSCCSTASCSGDVDIADEDAYSTGCLIRTLISLKFLFSIAAICLICTFILAVIAHLSVREAKQYVGDPLHTKIFRYLKGTDGDARKMLPDHSLRGLNEKLNFYCYELGKHLGLGSIISDIDYDDSMEAIDKFLDFIEEHPKFWTEELALSAMEDISRYFENIEMIRKVENEAKEVEDATAQNLDEEVIKNAELEIEENEEEIILEKSMTSPHTPGVLSSTPLEIAQVIHALEIHMGDQKQESTTLAAKLSTIFEESEPEYTAILSESPSEEEITKEEKDEVISPTKDITPEEKEPIPEQPSIKNIEEEPKDITPEEKEPIPEQPSVKNIEEEPMTPTNKETDVSPSAEDSVLSVHDDEESIETKSADDTPSNSTMKTSDDSKDEDNLDFY